ncbi:MAG TPA: metal ABC transporter substrate-binding protein [Ferrovibrio sp.]|uniref:metal ABC transporter substrate-binding protein n=1 Tax=Ferrovibrio sp. TaxID=1917215 RepID=UPI002ED365F8
MPDRRLPSRPVRLFPALLSLAAICLAVLLPLRPAAAAAAPLRVVATFSVLGDMAAAIGGEQVAVTALVPPGGDAHVYEPKPGDARTIAGAKLVIVNGLGMEGWIDRLIDASGYRGPVTVASQGIVPQTMRAEEADGGEADGGKAAAATDPHAWQNLANGMVYADNILAGLIAADPADAEIYRQRHAAYRAALEQLDAWVRAQIATVPQAKRRIITSHDAFGYFGSAYGIRFLAPVGISTDAEPSAAGVARLSQQIRREHVRALFIETMTDPRLMQQLAREAGAAIGPPLYSDTLSPKGGPADTYIRMFRHNVPAMVAAMRKN